MKMFHAACAALALVGASVAMAADQPKPFQSVMTRNIFSRTPPRPQNTRPIYTPTPRVERIQAPMIVGIVIKENDPVAFLSDPNSGRISVVRPGQRIQQGTIDEITLDTVTLRGGKPIPLGQRIGQDIVNTIPVAPATLPGEDLPVEGAADPGPAPAAVTPIPKRGGVAAPDAATQVDPYAELKAKRQAELNGGKTDNGTAGGGN